MRKLKEFASNIDGAVAVEYGIIATAMFLAIIPAFLYVSTGITLRLQSISSYFQSLG